MTGQIFSMICGAFRALGYDDNRAAEATLLLMALAAATNLYVLVEFVL